MSCILAFALLQDPDALRLKIAGAAEEVYSLESSSIRDLEIRVKGRWGDLTLDELERRVWWFNAGDDKRAGWSGGKASRPLTDAEKQVRSHLDRAVWAFLSNAADDQAAAKLEEGAATVERDGDRTRVTWRRPPAEGEFACWFDADGRLVRAGGEMLTFENTEVVDRVKWTDGYGYGRVAGKRCLTTLTIEEGELKAEWEEVDGGLLLKSIAGVLKGGVRVEIDLTDRAVGKGAAQRAYEASGR